MKTKKIFVRGRKRHGPWVLSVICETYICVHNYLELSNILPNLSFAASETHHALLIKV